MLQIAIINVSISIVTSAISVLLITFVWRQRHVKGTRWFMAMVGAVAWVTWWYAFEAAVRDNLEAYISLSKLEYIGLSFIPMFWLGFAIQLSGRENPFSRLTKLLLAVVPFITIALVFTNEQHGLIWRYPAFDMSSGAPVFDPEYGGWFWVYVGYSYIIFLFGSVILLRHALNNWRLYRVQALLILVGTALPWISNLIDIFDSLNPFPYLYLNAIFLCACTLFFAFALFRLRLFDIVPLAYDTILDNIPDGILVVDLQDRLLALNTNAKSLLETPHQDPIGKPIALVFPRYAAYFQELGKIDADKGRFESDDHVLETRLSPVRDRRGTQRGRLLVISDITAKAQVERTQRAEQLFSDTMRNISTTLNSSLDTNHVMSLILESLDQLMPHNRRNIMLIDEDGFTTRVHQHQGYSPEAAAFLTELQFDYRESPPLMQCAQTSRPMITAGFTRQTDGSLPEGSQAAQTLQSFATVPLLIDGVLAGFMNIDCEPPHRLSPEWTDRLQIFAQQAALAIKNARLYEQISRQAEELKRRVNSLTVTQQVYKDIGFSLNINSLAELALDASLRISMADAGYVALAKGNELELVQHYGSYDLDHLTSLLKDRTGIIEQIISNQRIIVAQYLTGLTSALSGAQAQIGLPLFAWSEDKTPAFYGVIVLETKHPRRFTEDRVQLLSLIADRVAVAFHNVRLVDTVQERAAELELLYDKLSYLEKFKSDMIRIAAHDLKNPLGVIRNYLSMLMGYDDVDLDLDKVYPAMLRSAERMLQIIQDFLSLDRIEQAAEHQTIELLDLSSIVSKVVDEFANRAAQKSQHLVCQLPHEECIIEGDAAQLYEAIANFLNNAIKYTPEGGHINVFLTQQGGFAQLEVQDDGYGVPEEQQEKLFQPFYRVQTRETTQIEGSGLGLHLTRNIIERHGGTVIFHSVYRQGSTFGFQMPLYYAQHEPAIGAG